MIKTNYQRYDFAAAARVDQPLRAGLNIWARRAAELFVEHWADFSQTEIMVSPANVDGLSFGEAQTNWSKQCQGVAVSFGDEDTTGLIVSENQDLLVLLLDVLGGASEGPENRTLTPIESDLAKLIFEAAAASFGNAWVGLEALSVEVAQLEEEPCRSRMFSANEEVLISGLRVQLGESTSILQLVLEREKTRALLGVDPPVAAEVDQGKSVSRENVFQLEVEISAELGRTKVDMSDLVAIEAGDILILDQPVDEPVAVLANGSPVFQAWPGKRINKQALRIETISGDPS